MLKNLEPRLVFTYFDEICKIPHGSGNVRNISNYLMQFAADRNLEAIQDELYNVIIKKPASHGMEERKAVIIQGHMDMVAVKNPGCTKDMLTEGLDVAIDGDWVYAKETSLGADDGIAVAFALAILDSDDIKHPPLEVVITTEEEVGMEGAVGIDLSSLNGKRMLNIDSETEGELTVSCAGGVRVNAFLPVDQISLLEAFGPAEKELYAIEILLTGLSSGHSGMDIHKAHGNAIKLMGELLQRLAKEHTFSLAGISGGEKDNVIPGASKAVIVLESKEEVRLEEFISKVEAEYKSRLHHTDQGLGIHLKRVQMPDAIISNESFNHIVGYVSQLPNGVQAMNKELPDMVETSLNLGIILLEDNVLKVVSSIRSSVQEGKDQLCQSLINLIEEFGGKYKLTGDYPAWEYKEQSKLRDTCVRVYRQQYKAEPVVLSVHAGLECGILGEKIRGLDSISFGPTMDKIHTTKEKLSISSTQRVWEFILRLLEEL